MEDPCARLFQRLTPHLVRACELNAQLGAAVATSEKFDALLEAVDGAVLVLDGRGRLLTVNAGASAMLRSGGLIRVGGSGQMRFVAPQANTAWLRTLGEALNAQAMNGGSAHVLRVIDGGATSTVTVLPLRLMAAGWHHTEHAARVLVVIKRTDAVTALPSKPLLRAMYGLSSAEADVALKIASGGDVHTAAEDAGVARATVRNQLQSAMQKMGVRRQADMVACIHGAVPRLKLP